MGNEIQVTSLPKTVLFVVIVLLLKPVLDIIVIQMMETQTYNWTEWLFLFATSISLLVRHKTAWMAAIFFCLAYAVSTGFHFISAFDSAEVEYNAAIVIDVVLVLAVVSTVAFYFRYPYMNRRQAWLMPVGKRYEISTPIRINEIEGSTIDLSESGTHVLLKTSHSFKPDDSVKILLTALPELKCSAKIVTTEDNHLRIHFEKLSRRQKKFLRQWIQSQNAKRV